MKKKHLISLLAPLALGVSTSVSAFTSEVISFDADGSGGEASPTDILTLDWDTNSTLVEGFDTPDIGDGFVLETGDTISGSVQTYSHSTLAGISLGQTTLPDPTGLNGSYEISFISGFQESVTTEFTIFCAGADCQVKAESSFSFLSGGNNFFEINYDDLDDAAGLQGNKLTGLGYDDGTVILTGVVESIESGSFTVNDLFSFTDTDADGVFTFGTDLITSIAGISLADGSGASLLDGADADDWSDGNWIYNSVLGSGSTTILVDVTSFDSDFFLNDIAQLTQDSQFTTENNAPHVQADPSLCFDTNTSGGKIGNADSTTQGTPAACQDTATFDLGGTTLGGRIINGFDGPDLLLQTDSSQSFVKTVAVPEPGVLAILGLGLGMLGFSTRIRRRF